jgi:hypothetical protein
MYVDIDSLRYDTESNVTGSGFLRSGFSDGFVGSRADAALGGCATRPWPRGGLKRIAELTDAFFIRRQDVVRAFAPDGNEAGVFEQSDVVRDGWLALSALSLADLGARHLAGGSEIAQNRGPGGVGEGFCDDDERGVVHGALLQDCGVYAQGNAKVGHVGFADGASGP